MTKILVAKQDLLRANGAVLSGNIQLAHEILWDIITEASQEEEKKNREAIVEILKLLYEYTTPKMPPTAHEPLTYRQQVLNEKVVELKNKFS